jgi:hypothetical protein
LPRETVIVCYNLIGCTCYNAWQCRCCTPRTSRTNDRTSLHLHGHYVVLAVHFYRGCYRPVVLAIVPGWLSVRCEIADPLLLVLSCAQPVVFVCCVYHVCFLLLGTQRTLQSPFASSDTCNYTRVGLMLSTGNAGQPCMRESVASAFFLR